MHAFLSNLAEQTDRQTDERGRAGEYIIPFPLSEVIMPILQHDNVIYELTIGAFKDVCSLSARTYSSAPNWDKPVISVAHFVGVAVYQMARKWP